MPKLYSELCNVRSRNEIRSLIFQFWCCVLLIGYSLDYYCSILENQFIFPHGSDGKESTEMWETWVQSLGWEDPLRRAWQPIQVFMPGEFPRTEEPGGLQSMGSQRVRHDWATELNWTELSISVEKHCWYFDRDYIELALSSVANLTIRSVLSLSHVRLCDPMDCSTPGLPVHHQLPEFTQTHVHWVCDAIQPSHPLSSPSPLSLDLS